MRQNGRQDGILTVYVIPILRAAVVAVFIAATKSLAEIILVFILVHVIAIIAIACILIGIRVSVVRSPPVLLVCLAGMEAFLIAIVHGLSEYICTVLIRFVAPAATIVTIRWSRVEVWIAIVVIVIRIPKT